MNAVAMIIMSIMGAIFIGFTTLCFNQRRIPFAAVCLLMSVITVSLSLRVAAYNGMGVAAPAEMLESGAVYIRLSEPVEYPGKDGVYLLFLEEEGSDTDSPFHTLAYQLETVDIPNKFIVHKMGDEIRFVPTD